ncbi:CPBP family intramembrane glutamic endopeptidase [uncultured Roseivirga sp.]|uniref:CPBP family intramembrane glutamic endopeptidase n=1 Tax=uncultured Roseivirga sp. TaxID=543088 RepID=UPI0030D98C7C|tara:strand:- start:50842 stop:51519 length:678 start_codon:yes stop_codon:yes gene_type:complete
MLGILIILLVSWLMLLLFEKKSLLALGFTPFGLRLKQFGLGFLVSAVICTMVALALARLKSETWLLSDQFSFTLLLDSAWYDLKSVFTEELIYRGALLYILIKKLGSKTGVLISAIAFGVYHWFSFGAFGNVVPMIYIFLLTGLMGLVWAYAFAKTKSIMLPFGLHLGWNVINNGLFSKGPLGEIALVATGGIEPEGAIMILGLVISVFVPPLVTWLFIKYAVKE